MPLWSLRETDPQGNLQATPGNEPSTANNILGLITGILGAIKKSKETKNTEIMNELFRTAAQKELKDGTGQTEYEYDPKTGSYKGKVSSPKPENVASGVNSAISRYRTAQQFGVDPITGKPVPAGQLKKPRFGYTGDIFAQLFSDPSAMQKIADDGAGGDVVMPGAPKIPSAAAALPANPTIDVPAGPGGADPTFLDPADLAAQNAIAAGQDPVMVMKRLAEWKAKKSAANGTV